MQDWMDSMARCEVCPWRCGVDRRRFRGQCRASDTLKVNTHQLHHFEEPPISGTRGSGTIFFSHCNLSCVFCQNHVISQDGAGQPTDVDGLAGMMLDLQSQGAHNVNLVSPTHYTPQIAEAIRLARRRGLRVPTVWNSSAYELPEALRSLEGLVDIYLPDLKYMSPESSFRLSGCQDYPERAMEAILEMRRQVGGLVRRRGVAESGLIVRLLVLPGGAASTPCALEWIASALGVETTVSLMGQYYPAFKAAEHSEMERCLLASEYAEAVAALESLGFADGFTQEVGSSAAYTPQFSKD